MAASSSTTRICGADSFTTNPGHSLRMSVEAVSSPLGRSSPRCDAVHQIVDVLGDVGGVIADALDVLGGEQQMRAQPDVARVFHHVGQQLAEQRIVHGVDALIVTPHRVGLVGVALGVGVQHVLELAERQLHHVLETSHQGLGMVLAGHGQRPLGDVLAQIADALQVAGDLQHRHDVAQVVGHAAGAGRSSGWSAPGSRARARRWRGRWRRRPRRACGSRRSRAVEALCRAAAPPARPSARSSCRAAAAPGRTI